MLFIVNDEENFLIFEEFSKKVEGCRVVYTNERFPEGERKVYINVKPDNEEDICFIDTWGMTDEIPQAHIVSKSDKEKKVMQVCGFLNIKHLI